MEHVWYVCLVEAHKNKVYDNNCNYCDYGLSSCTVCGGDEGSLTTHCRGEKLDETMLGMVAMGQADYVDGSWIVPEAARIKRGF